MANPWFRLYSEFAHDPKVQMMSESMQRRYVMLMCMRCGNVTEMLHETEIAFYLRITEAELSETKALFISKGFVDEQWNLLNWDKRQFKSDSSAERVSRHRANKKEQSNGDVTLQKQESNALDTEQIQNRTDTENPLVASDADDKPVGKASPDCPHQKIIDLYHEVLPMCPRVRDWTPARATQLRARWNEDRARQNLGYWKGFFEYVSQSDFLCGRVSAKGGAKPFCVDLEWITKSANFVKIREGKYHE